MNDQIVEKLRLPPHSIDAEQALLGALLQNNDSFDKIAEQIVAFDFYRLDHRKIYEVISTALGNQQQVDVLTVYESLAQYENNSVTLEYLNSIVQNTPFATNIESYAALIRERALLRDLIAVNTDIIEQAFYPQNRTAQEILDNAEARILDISQRRDRGTIVNTKDRLMFMLNATEEKYKNHIKYEEMRRQNPDMVFNNKEMITGITSGFVDLDNITGGLQNKDLIILAARPSMGKTALAVNIAEAIVFEENLSVLIFSMEMSADQLFTRILASRSQTPMQKIKTGVLDFQEWERLASTFFKVSQSKLFIDESAALTPNDLRTRARKVLRQSGDGKLGLIVVDYLQLMSGSQKKYNNDNRTNEISEISRGLKALAKEMDCPVIALSQLNRSVEQRPNKMPLLSDLRESGAIEQDADLILFIYRDEYYHPNTDRKGIADIKVAKNRNGKAGIGIGLLFRGECSRFENYQDYQPHEFE